MHYCPTLHLKLEYIFSLRYYQQFLTRYLCAPKPLEYLIYWFIVQINIILQKPKYLKSFKKEGTKYLAKMEN